MHTNFYGKKAMAVFKAIKNIICTTYKFERNSWKRDKARKIFNSLAYGPDNEVIFKYEYNINKEDLEYVMKFMKRSIYDFNAKNTNPVYPKQENTDFTILICHLFYVCDMMVQNFMPNKLKKIYKEPIFKELDGEKLDALTAEIIAGIEKEMSITVKETNNARNLAYDIKTKAEKQAREEYQKTINMLNEEETRKIKGFEEQIMKLRGIA